MCSHWNVQQIQGGNIKKEDTFPKVHYSIVILLVIAIEASVAMPLLSCIMDTYLGRGERYMFQIEGSKNWDTMYYDQNSTDTSSTTGSVFYRPKVS